MRFVVSIGTLALCWLNVYASRAFAYITHMLSIHVLLQASWSDRTMGSVRLLVSCGGKMEVMIQGSTHSVDATK